MRHVVFKTPGLLDIQSLTVFGLSAKPNANGHPIGKFGTGLKMAIAVLVRNNISVVFWIGRTKYTFKKTTTKFRNTESLQIKMVKEVHGVHKILSSKTILLPFTTELAKYWELWQAFRELESNTRDELGITRLVRSGDEAHWLTGHEADVTKIIVTGEAFVKEYLERERTFLPGGLTLRDDSTSDVQIIERPSQHIYWRGIRVHDLPEDAPSQLTYNILADIELTEDRTAKSAYEVEQLILKAVTKSEDAELVKKVVEAPKKSYERNLNYGYTYWAPSPTFSKAASAPEAAPTAMAYAKSYEPKEASPNPWANYPRPWAHDAAEDVIRDSKGTILFVCESHEIAKLILTKINEEEVPF